ncbi:CDP-alcohol phosphatidyltransferase family protein [Arthrobacter sp. Sa2BUA2]|uniref:CDP-alcohol phosphatidyltransferase family protein n=1 Tax=Arthrobacter pullicola TaxID=2762224 RepID=A0ABR8YFT3_9MICC|nr:CDP-alcohol phosphatidyltransferase family protein [Arthrobacter pullicola]MBD8043085.1 CDP-alcohol phosphatidyltransferase family protein [Arthrobacter pullicola]
MSRTLPQPAAKPGFRESFNRLKQAQKTRRGVPLYLLWVNRPAGRVVAAALRNTRIRPNHVTFAGAALTYGSLLWLAFSATANLTSALAGVLLALGYVLDSADGQLARLQGRSSAYGEWLDHILDNGRIAVMHVAAFCFLLRNTDHPALLLAACTGAFLLASSTIFFGGVLLDQLRRNATRGAGGSAGTGVKPDSAGPANPGFAAPAGSAERRRLMRRSVITLPVDYGMTCLAFLLLPWPGVFLIAYAVLAAAHVLMCAAFLPKWRSELLRLG